MSSGIAGAIYSAVGIAIGGGVLRLIFAALVRRTDRKFEPGGVYYRRPSSIVPATPADAAQTPPKHPPVSS